jgi:capsular exopolysaccharide synthesis family protein
MDFRTFIATIVASWKLVVGALLACLIGAGLLTTMQTKSYQSSATILISYSGATSLSDVYYGTEAAQERLASYAQIAGGHMVAERAVRQLHVSTNPDALVSQTHAAYTPKSTLMTVTVTDTDPTRVAALAGAMADQFAALVPTLGNGPHALGGRRVPGAASDPSDIQQSSPTTQMDAAQETPAPESPLVQPGAPRPAPLPMATATVIERPGIPQTPVKPVPSRNMAMGLVAGVLLGIGVALTRRATDRSVRNRVQLEQLSGVPTLAELPARPKIASRFGTEKSFDDAVRSFRTRLLKVIGPQARRILLAAPFGGEGTTTTALNLASAFAELDERALVIEGDVRKPTIARVMGVKSGIGFTDILADRGIAPIDAVSGTPVNNVFMVASRNARDDEILARSTELPNVVEDLATRFDRTIIDCPPVLATSDASLLADTAEAIVLVVRAGRTTFDEVTDSLHALRSAGIDVVGTVLTDARIPRHTKAAVRTYWRKPSRALVTSGST